MCSPVAHVCLSLRCSWIPQHAIDDRGLGQIQQTLAVESVLDLRTFSGFHRTTAPQGSSALRRLSCTHFQCICSSLRTCVLVDISISTTLVTHWTCSYKLKVFLQQNLLKLYKTFSSQWVLIKTQNQPTQQRMSKKDLRKKTKSQATKPKNKPIKQRWAAENNVQQLLDAHHRLVLQVAAIAVSWKDRWGRVRTECLRWFKKNAFYDIWLNMFKTLCQGAVLPLWW